MSQKLMKNLSIILIISSFFMFAIASYLKIESRYKLNGSIVSESKDSSINIETPNIDETTSEVVEATPEPEKEETTVKDDDKSSEKTPAKTPTTKNPTTKNPTTKAPTTKTPTTTPKPTTPPATTHKEETPTTTPSTTTPSITDTNNNLRNTIENNYNVDIKYGSETDGYTVGGMSVKSMTNANDINKALRSLNSALSLYPSGLYREVTSSYPLTILLINKYSVSNVTGVTDSSTRYVKLSIATAYPFDDSFHHETYHYLELYMKNRGMNYSSWDDLNPTTFTYGTIDNELSYSRTFSANSYFVNDYAQSAAEEDRASTFEYMMATSKASCLNYGKPVYKKAKYMADTMDFFIDACSSNKTERWERYL